LTEVLKIGYQLDVILYDLSIKI